MQHSLKVLVFLLAAVLGFTANAETYLGASGALQRVEELNAKSGSTNTSGDLQSKLRADLKAFQQNAANLPPAQAATAWLDLVDRAIKIQKQAAVNFNPGNIPIQADEVLAALPSPAVWKELAAAIAARPAAKGSAEMSEAGLRFLAVTLMGDTEGRKREIANLEAKAKDSDPQSMAIYRSLLEQLSQVILAMSDDPDTVLLSLERELDPGPDEQMQRPLSMPNLVAQVGPEKAEAFLRKALVRPVVLQFRSPNETSRLAQKLALELIDQVKSPQWGLVNSLDAVHLYEALDKRFPAATNKHASLPGLPDIELPPQATGGNEKLQAQAYYFLGLISRDRPKEAVAIAKKLGGQNGVFLPPEAFKAMERAGYTAALDNFFYELLSQDASLPFWDRYVDLAAKAGTTDRMLAMARAAAARPDLSDNKKSAIHHVLFKALLAADAVDEGVQEMRRLIASEPLAPSQFGDYESHGQLGVMLAQIGVLLQKPEWTDEGITVVKKSFEEGKDQNALNFVSGPVANSTGDILFKLNRGPEAEALLTEALAHSLKKATDAPAYYERLNGAQQILTAMAILYHRAARYDDVLTLLQQSPNWGVEDLSGLFDQNQMGDEEISLMGLHTASSTLPVPYLAANALIAAGRKAEAEKIINELLNREPSLDRGYELLIALKGTNAIAQLDQAFAQDQFEGRPLIWKAHLLREQGKLAEAETTVRQAIAIDPSDGQEGRGDRMRAYAELADVREALGDKKEADFYREIVKAIRVSEDADEFYKAGLLKRAIPMYEEGLNHFADAYCIQSRLAIQLAGLGKNQEAEEHYRRAYELMPDSFGRVESHCFGCERVFDGERAQGIAEKVFTKLAIERPDKPQVHYLLGYLRAEQERYNEARTNYQAAIHLDTNYLNAWIKLEAISQHVVLTPKERNDIAFNIVRLDPLQRHDEPGLEGVTDLAGLWDVVNAAGSHRTSPATNLFILPASKAALEKKKSSSDQGVPSNWQEMMQFGNAQGAISPGAALAQTPFVRFAGQLIINEQYGVLDQ